jgi:hypothetical protein
MPNPPLQANDPRDEDDLNAWQRELASRLERLRDLPQPPSFQAEATNQLLARLASETPRRPRPATARPRPGAPWPAFGLRMAGAMLVFLLALLGSGYATAASLPGNLLYPLKRQAEEARITFTGADQRDELRRSLLERRLAELTTLATGTLPEQRLTAGVAEYTAAIISARTSSDDEQLQAQLARHHAQLAALQADAPPAIAIQLQAAQQAAAAPPAPEPAPMPAFTATPSATSLAATATTLPDAIPLAATATTLPSVTPARPRATQTAIPQPDQRDERQPTAAPTRPVVVPPPLPTTPAHPAQPEPPPAPQPEPPPAPPRPEPPPAPQPEPPPAPQPEPPPAPQPEPPPAPQPEPPPAPPPAPQPEPPPAPQPEPPPAPQPEPPRPEPPGRP